VGQELKKPAISPKCAR